MLTILRENATKWLTQLVLWTLVASFVGTIFLVWGYGREKGGEKSIGKIGNHEITQAEYRRYYESMLRRVREMMGGELNSEMIKQFGLERSAMEGLVMERLQLIAAKEAGMEATDEDVKRDLESAAEFKNNGVFDRDTYFAVLRANNLAPKEYEKILRRDIMVRKIARMVSDSAQVTDQEVKDAFIRNNEQAKLRYVFLSNEGAAAPKADEKTLTDYFGRNAAQFTRPEERKVSLVHGQPILLMDKMQVTDAEVAEYYNAHKQDFFTQESVKASHILIPLQPTPSEKEVAEARAKAESVAKQAKGGADFAQLAKKYSSDKASAKNGGSLGNFGRGQMVQEFEQAAFSMAVGDISAPVRTPYGFHIIKVEGKTARSEKGPAEAAPQVRAKLLEQKSGARMRAMMAEVAADKSGKPLAELAKACGLQVVQISYRSGETIESVPDAEKLVKLIVNLKKGEIGGPVELIGGLYLARVEDIIPAHPAKFAEVKGEVEAAWKNDETRRLAEEAAGKAMVRLEKGEAFSAVAAGLKASVKETGYVKRGGKLEDIREGASILSRAFETKAGGAFKFPSDKGFYLVQLAELKQPGLEEFDKEKAQVRETLLNQKRQSALLAWQEGLRKDAEKKGLIKLDQRFM